MLNMKWNSLSVVFLFLCCMGFLLCLQARAASGTDSDRLALLRFKQGITGDPNHVLSSWNGSLHFCDWFGITCSLKHQRVTSLVLEGKDLSGSISPYIGNLTFLRFVNLQNNTLHGEVPKEFGRLFRLQELLLNNNTLQGEIPINLTRCSQLRVLGLQGNDLSGKIPTELGSLYKLEELWLGVNNLTGTIPPSLGNLSSLTFFQAAYNSLIGSIPDELGKLTSLTGFGSGANQLSGIIPTSIFNISSMRRFGFTQNHFNGSLPDNLNLPNLIFFGIGDNKLFGSIPNSLFNASKLEVIDLGWNYFVGKVPASIGNLNNLWRLRLHGNNLGSNSTSDLDFLTSLNNCTGLKILDFGRNKFGGILPNSVANLSTELQLFYFGRNKIRGTIPAGLESFNNLVGLVMHYNLFTGVVPSYFGKFQKLQVLDLLGNRLSGQIPSSLANLTGLSMLYLSRNQFEGSIPSSIGNLKNLNILAIAYNKLTGAIPHEILGLNSLSQALDLSYNSLNGNLPPEIGKLTSLTALFVSGNKLSGEIPPSIGNCLNLEYLFMQDNSFQGTIPSSFTSLKGLGYVDLSGNNLTGKIPEGLQDMKHLIHLNLSFNRLEGEVPVEGVFKNASALSLTGNKELCGGILQLNLPKCPPEKVTRKGKSLKLKLAIIIPCVALGLLLISAFLLVYKRRKSKKKSSSTMNNVKWSSLSSLMINRILLKVSYRDLCQATDRFSEANLIGTGNFGSVYKGFLDEVGRPVAVKVLKLEQKGASKSFISECKMLQNIRHRNLVKMLTLCSSIDENHNEFKALVFEFMQNGSLDIWLHPDTNIENRSRNLSFLRRLEIAIDVASALHYLHDLCKRPIIHCDLKPSNVLLDDDMVAHVCDFGLARLLSTSNAPSESQFSSAGFKGTIGYAPPEYGMNGVTSRAGDVYSFGILLLEMFSGRKPTDEMFKDGLNLHDFVKAALPERLLQVADQRLVAAELQQTNARMLVPCEEDDQSLILEQAEYRNMGWLRADTGNCLLSTFVIGINCSSSLPRERMSMKDVTEQLHSVKNAFLQGNR